ncbi:MAG: Cell surface protein [Ignavibacteriae bacterium]|nr:MAG: Cell surface protein [Ignavibacteriota bacterium]
MRHFILIILLFLPELAFTWGSTGHKIINRRATRNLPESMSIFQADSLYYEAHASDADNRRDYNDLSLYAEQWRHYIDIDDYPNFQNLPKDLNVLISIYGLTRVKENGTNPWAVIWFLDSLTAQLARNDLEKVKQTASDIGHYIADGFQPLHCTVNYNGQLTGNDGIHSRYETTMLNTFQSQISTQVSDIQYITSPIDYVFDYIIYSNSLVDSILQADNYAKAVSGWSGSGTAPSTYYNALWDKTKNLTIAAFQKATTTLASFWYTAYINSGKLQILPNPAQINFANIPLGSSVTDSVIIKNTTAEELILNVVNPDTQNFQIVPSYAVIPKGVSQKFYVNFNPSRVSTFSENIIFNHNLHIPPIYLDVQGSSYQRTFTINQNTINFSNLFVGDIRKDSVIINNTSGTNLNVFIINPDTLNFNVNPINLSIPAESSDKFYIIFHPKIESSFNLQFMVNHNLGTDVVTFNVTGNSIIYRINFSTKNDWNLISIPLKTFDSTVTSLFSNSLMDYFYSYGESGYKTEYILKNGIGYWAKFSQSQIVQIPGIPLYTDTLELNAGWNMIGSVSGDIPIQSLFTEPPDLMLSNFYGYDGFYFIADTLRSGSAYWVKANSKGQLILNSFSNNKRGLNINSTPLNPPPPPGISEEIVKNYILHQNYPNPFNPITHINYYLPEPANVRLTIYDLLGKEIITLFNGWQEGGKKSVEFDGSNLPAGVYFCKLKVSGETGYTSVIKMVLVK